jgi:hypothetical protein
MDRQNLHPPAESHTAHRPGLCWDRRSVEEEAREMEVEYTFGGVDWG